MVIYGDLLISFKQKSKNHHDACRLHSRVSTKRPRPDNNLLPALIKKGATNVAPSAMIFGWIYIKPSANHQTTSSDIQKQLLKSSETSKIHGG